MHDDAASLAAWAQGFEHKLARLAEHMDPSQLNRSTLPWRWIAQLPDTAVSTSVAAKLFAQHVAPLPDLLRLQDRNARVALLDRDTLLRQLCALALARRPAAVRCCIDSRARNDLHEMMGSGFDALLSVSHRGRALPEYAARWTPMHWSCLGFFDWAGLLQASDRAIRRMVRLSLPVGLLDVRRRRPPGADLDATRAVQVLDELGLEWSC